MVDYKKWFSPMAKTFCKKPPSPSTFETASGPRKIWHQEWKVTGGGETNLTVEIAAVGPSSEVKGCDHLTLDYGNCEKYLERALYQDCKDPTHPENIESGTISGGVCISYSFEVLEHHEGPEPPTFKIPNSLWPFSIDLDGLYSPGNFRCKSNSSQSISYKDHFSGMAKTFCKSPPAPDTFETDKGSRTIWKQDWAYGTIGTGKNNVVEIVALKSSAEACKNFEFSLSNCEQYLDGLLHLKCPLPSDTPALTSGTISGGACIAYTLELSTKEGELGLPSLFKPPDWLWPFSVPIKNPGDQMTAHQFVVSYGWGCDVNFNKLSSMPDCHAHWGLWTRWSQDDLITCDTLLDTDKTRVKLAWEDALLPTAQTDSPLHIASFAGLPLDLSKTIDLAFEGDCLSKCRFTLGTKDDFSDSNINCDIDDACSKTKRFGCIAAPPNSTIDCPGKQNSTGDRRFQTLFICNSSIPLLEPPSRGPWSDGHVLEPPTNLTLDKMHSANLLGFDLPDDYEFGLFQVKSCPNASSGGGALDGIMRTLQCKHYYALYVAEKGVSMNECELLNRGAVGDKHVWADATMNITAFDPSWKDWYPVTPDYAPQYDSFPHKANDRDTCAPNCFWSRIAHTGNPLSVIICKESPDPSKLPCFPGRYQTCKPVPMLDSKKSKSTCESNGLETTYWPIAYCNDKTPEVLTPPASSKKNFFLPGKYSLNDYSFAVYTFDCHDNVACAGMQFRALYAGPANTEMFSCDFTQTTDDSTWHYEEDNGDKDNEGFLKDPGDFPRGTEPYKDKSSNCWSNCHYKKDTQKLVCKDIEDRTKLPCFPPGEVQCTLPSKDATKHRLDCAYQATGQFYTPWAWCNAPTKSRYLLGEASTLSDYQFAVYALEDSQCHSCEPKRSGCVGHKMMLKASKSGMDMGTCDFVQTTSLSIWTHSLNVDNKYFSCDREVGHMNAMNDFPKDFSEQLPYQGGVSDCWSNCVYKWSEKKVVCEEILNAAKPPCFPPGEVTCERVPLRNRFRCDLEHPGRRELTVTPGAYCRIPVPKLTGQTNTCFLKFQFLGRPLLATVPFTIFLARSFDASRLKDLLKSGKSDWG